MKQHAAAAVHEPMGLLQLRPRPIAGLTRGLVAVAEAERELAAMQYRYQRAVDRMRAERTARYVAR
jgi:hypothetical protein